MEIATEEWGALSVEAELPLQGPHLCSPCRKLAPRGQAGSSVTDRQPPGQWRVDQTQIQAHTTGPLLAGLGSFCCNVAEVTPITFRSLCAYLTRALGHWLQDDLCPRQGWETLLKCQL